jgi:hypothetical protein
MVRMTAFVSFAALAACGGKGKAKVEEPPAKQMYDDVEEAPPKTGDQPSVGGNADNAKPAETKPAESKNLGAKAALQPVKGAKQPPGTVTFTQNASTGSTSVVSELEGLRPGRYHLVIHDGTECGESGSKAGGPWPGADSVKLTFVVGRDEAGNIDDEGVALKLDGAAPIIGQTLALHDDKKGQPGKILACGTIDAVGSAP